MTTTFLDNIIVFALFSIAITVMSLKFPDAILDYRKWPYKERSWEDGGNLYQRVLRVKLWKDILPELSDFVNTIFPRKRIVSYKKRDLQKYLRESCRAELTHWCIVLSSLLFGLWINFAKTTLILMIAAVLNFPYIIIQRYNRPRIIKILAYSDKSSNSMPRISKVSEKKLRQNILIISADNTGHGHKSIIEALQQQITDLDKTVQITVMDGFSLGKKMLNVASGIYNPLVVNMPRLWGIFYRLGNHFVKQINAFVSKSIEQKLIKLIAKLRPDVIVSVHAIFVGSILNILEKEQLDIPVIPLIADLDNVSALWADRRSACTLCPSEESKRTMLSLGIPEEKLRLVGFPVREEFCDLTPTAPKEGSVLDGKGASILLINGSQGSRKTLKIAESLLESGNCRITILAGNNASLKKYLERKLKLYLGSRVWIYGFTKDVKKHMLEADLLLLRASPNVLMEAINLCKPIVVTGALKGQEEKNPEFVVRHRLGIYCRDIKKLSSMVSELFSKNGKKLQEIYTGQLLFRNPLAAREIAEFIIGGDCADNEYCTSTLETDEDIVCDAIEQMAIN